ncbi:MAG TPA: SDR family oxidoreductase [Solirubrobacteraceae bacterium]|jgi:NAD(P)-dependent dehydrogenase (short-subunit alcohol dehydrogenase family)|nr:SDR family oxidoreductase [Solirubrobacteraceae bacterium]
MELRDRHIVLTGAASGIGRALAARFAAEGPRALVLSDVDSAALASVADALGASAVRADVGAAGEVERLIAEAEAEHGAIDVFFSNAGVGGPPGLEAASDEDWARTWDVNVMAHVRAARVLAPRMAAREDGGYLVSTASAAGLLTQVSAAAYSVTKHAAVALAEWVAINYGDAGVRVSCLCPQAVRTPMLEMAVNEDPVGSVPLLAGGVLEPEEVAEAVLSGMREERFLILPHPVVGEYLAMKGTQPERWLGGMRKMLREAREKAS